MDFSGDNAGKMIVVSMMDDVLVPWEKIASFVRQHTHDVRNHLNSLDLEATLLQEVVPQGEASEGVERIRRQVRSMAQEMRTLSLLFQSAQPLAAPMPASALGTIWREKYTALSGAPEVRWVESLANEQVKVDVEMMATIFKELLTNASIHAKGSPVTITLSADKENVVLEMSEPKAAKLDPSRWGVPFTSTRHGNRGLGLWTVKRLVSANSGTFDQQYLADRSLLHTRITLPRAG